MSAKKKPKAKEVEVKEVLEGARVLFQSRIADMTLTEEDRVASLDVVLMCASDIRSLGLRSGSVVLLRAEAESESELWFRCWSSPKLKAGYVTLNRAWWPNFGADMDCRFTSIRPAPRGIRQASCVKAVLLVLSTSAQLSGNVVNSAEFAVHLSSWLSGIKVCEGLQIGITFKASPVVLQFDSLQGSRDVAVGASRVYVIDHNTSLSIVPDSDKDKGGSDDHKQEFVRETEEPATVKNLGFGGYEQQARLATTILRKGLCSSGGDGGSNSPLFSRPKGMLLHGPPGSGKSLLARCLCEAMGCAVEILSHGVLLSLHVGDVEKALSRTFSEARRRAPCVVLIEDADILCRSRGLATSTSMHKSAVSSLLSLIDGLRAKDDQQSIFVLATSARPQDIDRAMRRPGRLDAEVELPAPTAEERADILGCILRSMGALRGKEVGPEQAVGEEDVRSAAGAAHGMVGSDLLQVAKEAFLLAAIRANDSKVSASASNDNTAVGDLTDALSSLHLNQSAQKDAFAAQPITVTGPDLMAALRRVSPSAIREVVAEVPRVLWGDIGGMHEVKTSLQEVVEWPLRHPGLFRDLGVAPTRGVLLYGPPGCSKTLMAKALATESGMNFLSVRGPELLSKWLGESEKAVQTLFRRARAAAPCIVFFDEIDALAGQRGQGSSGVSERVLAQLLTELDGAAAVGNDSAADLARVIVVAATNRPDVLDAALMRPGRIDRKIYVCPPDEASRAQILRLQLSKMPVEGQGQGGLSEEDLAALLRLSDGFSGAEVVAVTTEAAMLALDAGQDVVTMDDLRRAATEVQPQITPAMLDFYESFRETVA